MSTVPPPDVLENFVIDGSDRSVQDIISKLRFISKMQPGYVMDVSQLTLRKNTWSVRAQRAITSMISHDESRDATLEFIQSWTSKALELASRYLKSNEEFYRGLGTMILRCLKETITSLGALKETYDTDPMFVSRVEALEQTFKAKMYVLENLVIPLPSDDAQETKIE